MIPTDDPYSYDVSDHTKGLIVELIINFLQRFLNTPNPNTNEIPEVIFSTRKNRDNSVFYKGLGLDLNKIDDEKILNDYIIRYINKENYVGTSVISGEDVHDSEMPRDANNTDKFVSFIFSVPINDLANHLYTKNTSLRQKFEKENGILKKTECINFINKVVNDLIPNERIYVKFDFKLIYKVEQLNDGKCSIKSYKIKIRRGNRNEHAALTDQRNDYIRVGTTYEVYQLSCISIHNDL